jgi:hypothetical protein
VTRHVLCPECGRLYPLGVSHSWYRRQVRLWFSWPRLPCLPCQEAQDLSRRTGLPVSECRSEEVAAR